MAACFSSMVTKSSDSEKEYYEKGEIVEGVIERIQFPNKGIMSVEDTKVIVKMQYRGRR